MMLAYWALSRTWTVMQARAAGAEVGLGVGAGGEATEVAVFVVAVIGVHGRRHGTQVLVCHRGGTCGGCGR